MKIIYKKTKKLLSRQLLELYKSAKWDEKRDIKDNGKMILQIHKNSEIVISAWDKTELVGVIRALTDKLSNGVIFGLVVRPKYQKHGVGTKLIKKCTGIYPKLRWYLGAENLEVEKWYKKMGFKQERKHWLKRYKQLK